MAVVAERLVACCPSSLPLNFERTREGPVLENSGEMLLH